MKLKNLRKKIQRLEKRLREGPQKLAKLKQKLQAAEAAKAMKAARKSAARATAARPAAKPSASMGKKSPAQKAAKKPASVKKAKRKLNLSPERRAQLAAAMKARWPPRELLRRARKPPRAIINILHPNQPRRKADPTAPENKLNKAVATALRAVFHKREFLNRPQAGGYNLDNLIGSVRLKE